MALTGNQYGSKVARVGAAALVAHFAQDGTGALLQYEARFVAIAANGAPVLSVASPMPMVSSAWTFVPCASVEDVLALQAGQWTWSLDARSIFGLISSSAASPVLAVPEDGWKVAHSQTYLSVGGTSLATQWHVVADVLVGGEARALVSGGAFSNTVIGVPASFGVRPGSSVSLFSPVPLPVTPTPTTYTITVQVRAPDPGASVQTVSTRLALIEYF